MAVDLETPVTVYRKGKTRTIYKRQSCWFTGIDITPKDGDSVARDGQIANDRWTEEHIIPVSSHLFEATRDLWANSRRNIIPACAFANSCAGDLPLAIKFAMRDRLRIEFYGTQRQVLLAELLETSLKRLNERFGFEITPAIREAMVMDLSRHLVPKARGAR